MNQILSIGALLDHSWDHYRKHLPTLTKVTAWTLVIAAINVVAILLYPMKNGPVQDITNAEQFGQILLLVNNTLIALIVGTWVVNALIEVIRLQYSGQKVSMPQVAREARALFGPQLHVRVLIFLTYATSFLAPVGVSWFATHSAAQFLPSFGVLALTLLSLILLVIPIALTVFLAFPSFAVVEDKRRGWDAIKESYTRVHGRFWSTAMRLFVPKILYFIALFLVQYLIITIVQIMTVAILPTADPALTTRINWITLSTSYAVLFVFLNPLLFITDYLVYLGLKK